MMHHFSKVGSEVQEMCVCVHVYELSHETPNLDNWGFSWLVTDAQINQYCSKISNISNTNNIKLTFRMWPEIKVLKTCTDDVAVLM